MLGGPAGASRDNLREVLCAKVWDERAIADVYRKVVYRLARQDGLELFL